MVLSSQMPAPTTPGVLSCMADEDEEEGHKVPLAEEVAGRGEGRGEGGKTTCTADTKTTSIACTVMSSSLNLI